MKVVLDTNVVVSAFLSPDGVPAKILEHLRNDIFQLLISPPILDEYRRALMYKRVQDRHGLSADEIDGAMRDLGGASICLNPATAISIVESDADDNKFFECAVEGNANYIVSGDSAVQRVREYQGIQVLSPALFLALLEQS
jgi:putative PIN family toxin of toxin-antitoxin system